MRGIGSRGYGGWEAPHRPSASWDQESRWCDSVSVWKLENQQSWCCKSQLEGRRRWMRQSGASVRQENREDSPPAPFVPLGPQQTGRCPPTLGRATCFTTSTDSNAHLARKHPHTRPESCLIRRPVPIKVTQNLPSQLLSFYFSFI